MKMPFLLTILQELFSQVKGRKIKQKDIIFIEYRQIVNNIIAILYKNI
jgi:hypothetical protein